MPSHTPGPWRVDPGSPQDIQCAGGEIASTWNTLCNGEEFRVTGACTDMATSLANARLIAAAPDLLAACKLAIPEISCLFNQAYHRRETPERDPSVCAALDALKAAIAAAEGTH
jgi:hypothetical protein